MLPYGSLRDLPDRAQKADVILVTKCPANMQPIDMRVVDNKLALPVFQQLHFTAIQYSDINYQGIPLLVCGIAQPRYVIEYVKTKYPQALVMTFPDHYPYKDSDVNNIVKQAAKADFVITTEKDMQRLNTTDLSNKLQAINMPLCVLPVSVKFKTDAAVFDKKVITYIRENNRKK
jgi:tetraacyldisaccharide 4'-kinase